MAKRNFGDEFGFQTRAVHTGNDVWQRNRSNQKTYHNDANSWTPVWSERLGSAGENLYTQRRFKSAVSSGKACVPWERRDCVVLATVLRLCQDFALHCSTVTMFCIFKCNIYCGFWTTDELLKARDSVLKQQLLTQPTLEKRLRREIIEHKLIHIETPGNPTHT